MKGTLRAAMVGAMGFLAVALAPAPVQAVLIADGVTYELESLAPVGQTKEFALRITGENTASDTEKGRTGINGIAFNEVANGATLSGHFIGANFTPANFAFVLGGLQAGGCVANPNPNFFCFDNTLIPPTPTTALAGPLVIVFDVTLKPGFSWNGYDPSFKIDWVGSQNNYDLVSQVIGIDPTTNCPDCSITPVIIDAPEPATLAVLGMGLVGLGVAKRRRLSRV